jgi:hypothetical protein
MSEVKWAPCTTCDQVKPVFMYLQPNRDPYCHECGVHRLQLETFPIALEDVPIVEGEG